MGNIPNTVRVKMLKNYKVSDRHTAKKGKEGSYTEEIAEAMIEAGAAEKVIVVNSFMDIIGKPVKRKRRSAPAAEPQADAEAPTEEATEVPNEEPKE